MDTPPMIETTDKVETSIVETKSFPTATKNLIPNDSAITSTNSHAANDTFFYRIHMNHIHDTYNSYNTPTYPKTSHSNTSNTHTQKY